MPVVAIIGTGLIGRAWAHVFARGGWTVRLWDPLAEVRAGIVDQVTESLHALARHGLVDDPAAAAARLAVCDGLEAACAGVDFVQESGPERVEAKRDLFARLDAAAPPGAILASSTSAIVASRFTEDLPGRARCLIGHPVNPPHLVPVVELCGAPWTSPEAIARARRIYAGLGQSPVEVRREIDGFVLNRLQGALLAEAFRLVEQGYCTPQDLDTTIADGLGRRWAFMGPFATIELNAPAGIADYCERYAGFCRAVARDPAPESVFDRDAVARIVAAWGAAPDAGQQADGTRWRDQRLAALAAHFARQPARQRSVRQPGDPRPDDDPAPAPGAG